MNRPPSRSYILVLEDDQTTRELLEIVLTDEGYEARSAGTVSQALAVARERQPAVILFDMLLPDEGGEGFVRAYRALPGAMARLIAVSGIADLEDEAGRIGADAFLAKPFELDELLAVVAKALLDADRSA